MEEMTSHHGLHKIIYGLTHVLPNSASYIDLLFTSQAGLMIDSGIHPSLFTRCHR